MTSCRMYEIIMEWDGFLAQNRFFAEAPFSDQNQTASMKFDILYISLHLLHFPWQNSVTQKGWKGQQWNVTCWGHKVSWANVF